MVPEKRQAATAKQANMRGTLEYNQQRLMMIKRKPQTSQNQGKGGLSSGLSHSVNFPEATGRRNKLLHPPATAKVTSMPRPKPSVISQRLNPWELPVSLPLRGVPATITDRMRELYGRCEVMKQNYETHALGLFNDKKHFERQESHPHIIPETVRKSIDLKRPSIPNVALDMAVRQPLATKIFDFQPQREAANCSRVSANTKPD